MAKLIIIDDDPQMLDLYERTFTLAKFDVSAVSDGEVGLSMARKNIPDAIVLDIMMPGMNGMQVLEKIKSDPKIADVVVVMLTNVSDDSLLLEKECLMKGADRYLVKSDFDPKEVVEIVKLFITKSKESKKSEEK